MTYPERFIDVVATCLADLEAGRADIATCTARYPEYPQLGPMLALAAALWALPLPERDPALAPATDLRVHHAITRQGSLYRVEPALATPGTADTALQRRRHPRVPVLLEGRLWIVQRDGGERRSIPITVVDVSAGGLGFEVAELLEPGAAVEIELHLPRARQAQHAPASIVAVLARQWPRPATAVSTPAQRSRRDAASRLAALARIVHCGAPHGDPATSVPVTFRGGAEIVALSDRARAARR
jgi:hypothetical protein